MPAALRTGGTGGAVTAVAILDSIKLIAAAIRERDAVRVLVCRLLCFIVGHQLRGSVPKVHYAEVYCRRCRLSVWRFGGGCCTVAGRVHPEDGQPVVWDGRRRADHP